MKGIPERSKNKKRSIDETILTWFALIFMIFVLLKGVEFGFEDGIKNDCTYDSILSRTVLSYPLTCELAKPRFDIDNY